MANYVDGFVIPIKKKNLKPYKKNGSSWMQTLDGTRSSRLL